MTQRAKVYRRLRGRLRAAFGDWTLKGPGLTRDRLYELEWRATNRVDKVRRRRRADDPTGRADLRALNEAEARRARIRARNLRHVDAGGYHGQGPRAIP